MDGQRFDCLARTLTTGAPSRRIAARLAAGAAFAALLSRSAPHEATAKKKKKRCKKVKQPGQKCKKNGKKCKCSGGAKCQGKRCRCPGGQTVCNGACGIACGDSCCASGQDCLSNGSCALSCASNPELCPSGCRCVLDEDGDSVCNTQVDTFCPPGTEQTCESTADCAVGSVCTVCDGPVGIDFYCVALCGV